MQAIMIGRIADAVSREINDYIPFVHESVLKSIVGKILPKHGVIIEATRDELKNDEERGAWLYQTVESKAKDDMACD